MARGWESKSVEDQISASMISIRERGVRKEPSPEVVDTLRRKENILLSRTRVVHDLETAQNPRYRDQLTRALADLDAKLNTFGAH
jgi:hypothetical protein